MAICSLNPPGNLAIVSNNVIVLGKYSFENYLWEKEPVNRACLRHAQCGEKKDAVGPEFERLNQHLEERLLQLVVLDIAARKVNPAPKVLPDRVETILEKKESIEIDASKVTIIVENAKKVLDEKALRETEDQLAEFLVRARFMDILKGHFVFSVLRKTVTDVAASIRGKKVVLNDEVLAEIMADMVWSKSPSTAHKKLKRKIRALVRKLIQSFPRTTE